MGSRRLLIAGAIGLFVLGVAACETPDKFTWHLYQPESKSFSVLVPFEPQHEHQSSQVGDATVESDVYVVELPDGGFFTVVESTLPRNIDDKGGAGEILESSCARLVESASGTELGRKEITLGPHKGREVEATVPDSEVPGGGSLRARVYLARPRLFEVIVIVPRGDVQSSSVTKFLDSFKVAGMPQG